MVSTKIPDLEHKSLVQHAKEFYLQGKLPQPNISQVLAYIITDWLARTGKRKDSSLAAPKFKKAPGDTQSHIPLKVSGEDEFSEEDIIQLS